MSFRRTQQPQVVAHRGNSSEAPDNSEAAVRSAMELGADMVEVDVQVTSDGVGVLFHDEEIVDHGRTTTIGELPWPTVDGLLGPYRLDRLLDLAGGVVPLNLDVKDPAVIPLLVREIDRRGLHDHVVISGCTARLVRRHAEDGKRVSFLVNLERWEQGLIHFDLPRPIARLLHEVFRRRLRWLVKRHHVVAVNCPKHGVDERLMRMIHGVGSEVWCYTADDGDEIDRLTAAGVDSITTNRPRFVLERLGRRDPDQAAESSS
ncbi:MAG: glycerophosphodiester phosphodiesterase [Actinomycetota bacterium]